MLYAVLLLMCVAFVEVFRALRMQGHLTTTMRISRESLAAVQSKTMSDDEKEIATRRSSVALIQQTGLFVGKLLLTMLAPVALFFLAVHVLGVDEAELTAQLLSPLIWLAMTAAAALYVWIRHAIARRL